MEQDMPEMFDVQLSFSGSLMDKSKSSPLFP